MGKCVEFRSVVFGSYTTTAGSGTWSVAVTAAQAQALANGSYTVKANVSDLAGNPATQATQAITVDETKPTIAKIGRASCRERVEISAVAASLKKNTGTTTGAARAQTVTVTIVNSSNVEVDACTPTAGVSTCQVAVTPA